MSDSITFDFDVDMERLLRAMDTPDDIGSVLRVHLELERALDHVISRVLPKPEKTGWRYPGQKINFLLALGIPEFRMKPAQIINNIRNGFAHKELQETVREKDVKELFDALNRVIGGRLTEQYVFIRKSKSSDVEISRKIYKDMETRERFCLLGFIAIGLVAIFVNEFSLVKPKGSMPHIFVVRATVPDESKRAAFDVWYSREHLPDAVKSFGCKRAWRHWLANDPAVHLAMYEFPDRVSLDSAVGGEEMKRLIRDFDRDWPDVKRMRDIMVQAESWPA